MTHWRKNQTKDKYFQQAKTQGYRARSAYKLEEINQRYRIIRAGDKVLDLGAAPGSWSQVALQLVGKTGKVVAVDLQPIEPLPELITLQGDVRTAPIVEQLKMLSAGGWYDVVISDMAPNAIGIRDADHARSIDISLFALTTALQTLRKGGHFVTKAFMGEDFDKLLALTRRYFQKATVCDPHASRRESKETFIVATHLQRVAVLDANLGVEELLSPSSSLDWPFGGSTPPAP